MEQNVVKAMKKLNHLSREYINKNLDPAKILNSTQLQIVNYLIKHEEVIQKDLEIETQLKKSSITGCIDSLEKRGIVQRVQSKDDKRKNYIVLTPFALEKKEMLEERVKKLDAIVRKDIEEDELKTFVKVLNKMLDNLVKES